MCRSISLLSGKGGSGKTTLALSMASMLSSCGVKVLLIDCDLSTNGATYFYEEKLSTKKNQITSFHDILFKEKLGKVRCVEINENYDFIPSVTQITKKSTKTYSYKNDSRFDLYDELCQKYEVILFDCQAGYTDILKLILPSIDVHLVVMEADAISSAAMRSLYLKIGDTINEKKVYQVFNKASKEEYEIYSKVSGGTVFTNIDTIMFDWRIRKAFSISQIPDLENTSANYGEQIYNVCATLFQVEAIQSKIKKFRTILNLHSYKEQEAQIKSELNILQQKYRERKGRFSRIITLMLPLILVTLLCLIFYIGVKTDTIFSDKNFEELLILPILLALFTTALSCMNLLDTSKERREHENEVTAFKKQLNKLVIAKEEEQKKLEEIRNNTSSKVSKK